MRHIRVARAIDKNPGFDVGFSGFVVHNNAFNTAWFGLVDRAAAYVGMQQERNLWPLRS
mgnify:CR=1 FL=1